MIHTDRAIVVEGKYDKIKLKSVIDGTILCTDGFRIYRDKELQQTLRALARKQGLAVLTDSDAAGFQIRSFLRSICGKEYIVDVYIPDLYGKERRKAHPSKEGKLGVEGVSQEVLCKAFADAGIGVEQVEAPRDPITKLDLFTLGLSGSADSAAHRLALTKKLGLPEHLSTNALVTVLAALYTRQELYSLCGKPFSVSDQSKEG